MTMKTLADKATLVKLTQRSLGLVKRESQLTADLQTSQNDTGLVVMSKLFTDKNNPVNQALKLQNELYTFHRKHTLPYVDGGSRLLPNATYLSYTQGIADRRAELSKWANDHAGNYDLYVRNDIAHRASRGNPRVHADDYPTVDRLLRTLDPVVVIEPLPDVSHFLFDISEDDKANFLAAQQDRIALAQTDAIARIMEPLGKLIAKLDTYTGGSDERFHTSLVSNVIEGARLSKDLTMDAPKEYTEKLDELMTVANRLSVESLRENESYRDTVKTDMTNVMDQLAFFAPK